jgi:hypothetical protein
MPALPNSTLPTVNTRIVLAIEWAFNVVSLPAPMRRGRDWANASREFKVAIYGEELATTACRMICGWPHYEFLMLTTPRCVVQRNVLI